MSYGAGDRSRTCNLTITNRVHCQLCYAGIQTEELDSNQHLISFITANLSYLWTTPGYFMERDTGLEPAPSARKAEMLATDTNPANAVDY